LKLYFSLIFNAFNVIKIISINEILVIKTPQLLFSGFFSKKTKSNTINNIWVKNRAKKDAKIINILFLLILQFSTVKN
jgi:hypothetical protein